MSLLDSALVDVPSAIAAGAGGIGVLVTGLLLGIRHGFDWDHIAAITDITSTSAAADAGTELHEADHAMHPHAHGHSHGGADEIGVHRSSTGSPAAATAMAPTAIPARRVRFAAEQRHAVVLGTLYALGHASVVFALGLLALTVGAILPDWVDPIMGRVVGLTLVALGAWVFVSIWRSARGGAEFRFRSRWMLVFDGIRYGWRTFQARFHGHEHVEPLEMSSYGRRTALGVGMIHGIGAETGSQALLIAAVGGASGAGLGVPMLVAFSIGLVAANTAIVVLSTTGFVAGQVRRPIYLAIGALAGTFSIAVGLVFVLGTESMLPDLTQLLGGAP